MRHEGVRRPRLDTFITIMKMAMVRMVMEVRRMMIVRTRMTNDLRADIPHSLS